MKNLSLKLRLLIFFTGMSCIIWLIAGAVSWRESRDKIDEFFDQYQMILARQLTSADWSGINPETQKITNKIIKHIHGADEEDEAAGFAVFDHSGNRIFHDNENGKDFKFAPQLGNFVEQRVDDEKWRILWVESADKKFIIAVGQELEYRSEIALDMAEEFLLPWLIGLLILLAAVIYFIDREFAPLKRLVSALYKRAGDDLSPLETKEQPREVLPLLSAMNRLLQQIDEMLRREKSFISDSAHELRSPLTALKVQLEVLQLSDDDAKTRQAFLCKMEQGIERCARLVEQLLLLSKIESGFSGSSAADESIDWKMIFHQIVSEYETAIKSKKLITELDNKGDGPFVEGNPVLAQVLLRNLFDNAVKYSPEGALIRVEIAAGKLRVFNSGVKIDEYHIEHLSERFYRPAGQKENGSGLGLSIVGKIATKYGCCCHFDNQSSGFSVIVDKI